MSISCLPSCQAKSAVWHRAPSPVSCWVRTFQLANTSGLYLLNNLSFTFFDRVWDNRVAAVGHPGKVELALFGPPLLSPSSTGGEQCGCQEGLLSHPGNCRIVMPFHSYHSATIWTRPPTCRVWTRGRQLYPEPGPVIHSSIAEGLFALCKRERCTTWRGRIHVLMKFKVRWGCTVPSPLTWPFTKKSDGTKEFATTDSMDCCNVLP